MRPTGFAWSMVVSFPSRRSLYLRGIPGNEETLCKSLNTALR
jgi:hypothetical protein